MRERNEKERNELDINTKHNNIKKTIGKQLEPNNKSK